VPDTAKGWPAMPSVRAERPHIHFTQGLMSWTFLDALLGYCSSIKHAARREISVLVSIGKYDGGATSTILIPARSIALSLLALRPRTTVTLPG
jgi:hypothetical protein